MLQIYTSNRQERLLDKLIATVREPLAKPFSQEFIVVQSQGMARWLSLQLAQQLGVWANAAYPFPQHMVTQVFRDSLGWQQTMTAPFEREVLVWRIMQHLPDCLPLAEFAEVQHYLSNDHDDLKRFQLAIRIADTFDQYMVFRSDMIADWDAGKMPDNPVAQWQAILWQRLVAERTQSHRAQLRAQFLSQFEQLQQQSQLRQHLPERISLFGIPALPPYYLDVLTALGQVCPVNLFLLNPCQEYWGDIVTDSVRVRREQQWVRGQFKPATTLHYETGNSLLASLGKLGRDFNDLLIDRDSQMWALFEPPSADTLLHALQTDILYLQERGAPWNPEHTPLTLGVDDNSIQIHACHSPMREVEVLHDQLLALFEQHADLTPKDIVVMMPDIDAYAPFIQAVFATAPMQQRIPFSIADRQARGASQIIDTFFKLLELNQSRLTSNEVLNLIEAEAVQQRFKLQESDIDLIRHWVAATEIRWGWDADSRAQLALPALTENTWAAGVQRLLLGYAMPAQDQQLFQEVLPYSDMEGTETVVLGQFVDYLYKLTELMQFMQQTHSVTVWSERLQTALDDFIAVPNEQERELQAIRHALQQWQQHTTMATFATDLSSAVVLNYLQHQLATPQQNINFLSGQVTFCAMLPMRSIPFQVVCMLGMNDKAYPRQSKPLSFDLIAQQPRRGDRSLRDNDRYLFLEALLSARRHFYLSYVGHSSQDNSVLPPSVLVSELLDTIERGYHHPSGDNLRSIIVTHHPLQPFSPRYFQSDSALFSYSEAYCQASQVLSAVDDRAPNTFLTQTLPSAEDEWKSLDLSRLLAFFRQPTQFLLKQRLGINLTLNDDTLDNSEPFQLDALTRYQLRQDLLNIAEADVEHYHAAIKASGRLPHGNVGSLRYQQLQHTVQPFLGALRPLQTVPKLVPQTVHLRIGEFTITGQLNTLYTEHALLYRCAKLRAKDRLQAWLQHLVLNCLDETDLPRRTVLVGLNDKEAVQHITYQPVADAQTQLQQLLAIYWNGLHILLPFFPEASLEFVLKARKDADKALNAAKFLFQPDKEQGFCEGDDPYYRLAYGQMDLDTLFNQDFKRLAQAVYAPLLGYEG